MRAVERFRAAVWLLLAASLSGATARAQYGQPGVGNEIFSSAGDSGAQSRYSKATKGSDIKEWVRRLNDDDPNRRLEAVKSLGNSNDAKAIDWLIQAVGDPDPRVEAKAVDYLGKLRAADSTPFLVQKLFTVGTRHMLRHRILMTLGKIGDPRASRPILQYVMQSDDIASRGAGIYAIGEIADVSIRDELKKFSEVEDDPRLKRLVSEALIKIATRQPPAVPKNPSIFPTALEAALSTERQ